MQRTPPGPLRHAFGRLLAIGLLKPITWLLQLLGLWPRILPSFMRHLHRSFGGYRPTANDVLICSYFKSGTNWTMQIAIQTAFLGMAEFDHIHDLVPWPEISDRLRFAVPVRDAGLYRASPTGLKVIKTHLMMSQIPYNENARYICVFRDPKDVFVSSYHFVRAVMLGPLMPTPGQWLDLYLSRDTPLGSWAEHLDGFWRIRDRENVLVLTYEEMRGDPQGAVDRIAACMGVSLSPAQRASVLERSSFDHMKAITGKFDPVGMGPPWADARGSMVRRGEAGSAREMLNDEQRARIDDFWRSELRRLGSDFPYDEAFG